MSDSPIKKRAPNPLKKIFIKSKEQILKEKKRDEVFINAIQELSNKWRQIKALYKALKIEKKDWKVSWNKRNDRAFSKELIRLRKLESRLRKGKKKVPKKIEPEIRGISSEYKGQRVYLYKRYVELVKKLNNRIDEKKKKIKIYPLNTKGLNIPKLEKLIKKYKRPKFKIKTRIKKVKIPSKTISKINLETDEEEEIVIPEKETKWYYYTKTFLSYKNPDEDNSVDSSEIRTLFPWVNSILAKHNRNDFFTIKLRGDRVDEKNEITHEQRVNSKDIQTKEKLIKFTRANTLGENYEWEKQKKRRSNDSGKIFRKQHQFNHLIRHATQFNSGGYYYRINQIEVLIIPQRSGSCNEKSNKIFETGDFKLISRKSKNNNCFFSNIKESCKFDRSKNNIRKHFKLRINEGIPVKTGLEIFKKYRISDSKVQNTKSSCQPIKDNFTKQLRIINTEDNFDGMTCNQDVWDKTKDEGKTMLYMIENHYFEISSESYQRKKCSKCFKMYKFKHSCILDKYDRCKECNQPHPPKNNCDPIQLTYYQCQIKKNGRRWLIDRYKEEVKNKYKIIHYDLETHIKNKLSIQTPCVVGFINYESGYQYYSGNDCLETFIDYLLSVSKKLLETYKKEKKEFFKETIIKLKVKKEFLSTKEGSITKEQRKEINKIVKAKFKEPEKIYVNAYNGSNFDHYMIVNKMLKRGLKFDHFCLNNGSIIRARYKNIEFIDLKKHITGSLRNNLIDFKCKTLKEDFDYKKLDEWGKMKAKDKTDCLTYLKNDVLGLEELYNKLNDTIFDKHKINISSFYSTSHATYTMWSHHLMKVGPKEEKGAISIPTLREEKAFRPSLYGGRCYKSKHKFVSSQREQYLNNQIGFENIDDYIIDADVVSLYPDCMANNQYPIGEPIELKDSKNAIADWNKYMKNHKQCEYMGIFYIKYISNKWLSHGVLPSRTQEGLRWTLKDGEGYYTSVDIKNALKFGYKVEIVNSKNSNELSTDNAIGCYWKKTLPIFKSYIKDLYKDKQKAEKGSPQYALAKLFMNGLYGKCIQKPIDNATAWCKNTNDFWNFHNKNNITDVVEVNGQLYVSGFSRDEAIRSKSISKPTYLGSFILAYSREKMLNYMWDSNPYFDISAYVHLTKKDFKEYQLKQLENDIFYTDTDSIHIHRRNMVPESKLLGGITNDLGDGCKVLKGIWIAPKLYMLEYIKKNPNEGLTKKEIRNMVFMTVINGKKIFYHLRGKGVSKTLKIKGKVVWQLNPDVYEKMNNGEILKTNRDLQMKKIGINRNSKQEMYDPFSIFNKKFKDTERTLNKTLWNGRNFKLDSNRKDIKNIFSANYSLPHKNN